MCTSGYESVHKMRFMSNLLMQVKADYARLKELWEKLKKGRVDKEGIEEVHCVLSYLKKDLRVFEEMKRRGIEGVLWGEIESIENDVFSKETDFKMILMSGFGEPVDTHLR